MTFGVGYFNFEPAGFWTVLQDSTNDSGAALEQKLSQLLRVRLPESTPMSPMPPRFGACCYWKSSWSRSDCQSWRAQFVPHRNFPWSSSGVKQMLRCWLPLQTGLRLAPLPNTLSTLCLIFFWLLQSASVVAFERVNFIQFRPSRLRVYVASCLCRISPGYALFSWFSPCGLMKAAN